MALSRRQRRAYTDTVDLYRPNPPFTIGANNVAGDPTLPVEGSPTYTGVLCHWESKPEVAEPRAPARTNTDNMFTIDVFHFPISQEIGEGWFIKLTTPSHPEAGSYFVCQGDAQNHAWRAAKKAIHAKKTISPF